MGEDQALERLAEILARPEYQAERSVPWWQQAFGPLLDLIGYVLARLVQTLTDSATGREGWLGIVVLGVCAVLIVVVVVYLARAIRLSVTRDTRLTSASLSERRERSDQLWRSAERFAASGELAEAVRLLYLSALYALDERALLHVERALTNREHARRLDQLHPTLGQAREQAKDFRHALPGHCIGGFLVGAEPQILLDGKLGKDFAAFRDAGHARGDDLVRR